MAKENQAAEEAPKQNSAPEGEVWVEAIEPLNKAGKTILPKGKTTLPREAAKTLEGKKKLKIIEE